MTTIGVPREVKDHEYRVALTPAGADELVRAGHTVLVERDAGLGSSLADDDYRSAGACILPTADDVWSRADLILKVKEPTPEEYRQFRAGQVLFTYLHLAAAPELAKALLAADVTAIAYETVQLSDGSLPLLAPMSEVAGRMSVQIGAHHLQRGGGGRGMLIGGVPGVAAAKVVIIGAGIAGMSAVAVAVGMQAEVLLLDRNIERLREADHLYRGRIQTVASSTLAVAEACLLADLVIGAVLVPGDRAPIVVHRDLIAKMKPGSVLVDLSVDQGGCFEPSRPTTHSQPTLIVHESLIYCVANIPGAVPHTSTQALTNATLPFLLALAQRGVRNATYTNEAIARGVNIAGGVVTHPGVADALGVEVMPLADALAASA